MRVLRITPLWDWRTADGVTAQESEESVGGQATQALRITNAVAALGVEQKVVTVRAAGRPPTTTLESGLEVVGVGRPGISGVHMRNMRWLTGVLADLPRRRREQWDVVHVHASGIVEPLLAARAARSVLRKPLVLTLHASAQATYVPVSRRDKAVTVLTRAAERSATRSAARTLTLTQRTADAHAGTGTFEAMPDSLDTAAFAAAAQAGDGQGFLRAAGVPERAPVVLYAGRLSREKGWPDLPELTAALPDVHVVVCGPGPGFAELEALGDPRIHLMGTVAPELLAAAMAASDVLVLPSVFEELGSVLIEAMTAGLVSVAYDVGGVSEAVVEDVTGLLVPGGDTAALTAAVARALADDGLRERARTEGPRIAAERYDHTRIAARLVEIYDEVAET